MTLNNNNKKLKILDLESTECVECNDFVSDKKKIPVGIQRQCFVNGYIISENCSWHLDCLQKIYPADQSLEVKNAAQQFIIRYKNKFKFYSKKEHSASGKLLQILQACIIKQSKEITKLQRVNDAYREQIELYKVNEQYYKSTKHKHTDSTTRKSLSQLSHHQIEQFYKQQTQQATELENKLLLEVKPKSTKQQHVDFDNDNNDINEEDKEEHDVDIGNDDENNDINKEEKEDDNVDIVNDDTNADNNNDNKKKKKKKKKHNDICKIVTNKWRNKIVYELTSSSDCYGYCGLTKENVIDHAKICNLLPTDIFYMRVRMYKYLPWSLMSLMFGRSEGYFENIWNNLLIVYYRKYAKTRFVNCIDPPKKKYWTRQKIRDNTPSFVYRLRNIDKNCDDILVVNQDGTYQFIDTPQTDHLIRKGLKNGHKHRHLVKIHIIATTSGRPIHMVAAYSDGYHSDSKIFNYLFDERYLEICYEKLKTKEQPNLDPPYRDFHAERKAKNANCLKKCSRCDQEIEKDKEVICNECKSVIYCSLSCQQSDLTIHESYCKYTQDDIKATEKLKKKEELFKTFVNDSPESLERVLELMELNRLIKKNDHFVCDNGYTNTDTRLKRPAKPPKKSNKDFTASVQECNWKRGITAIRQVQERLNGWCKRYKMHNTKLHVSDIAKCGYTWAIVLADINYFEIDLMKDNEDSKALTDKLLDLRPVDVNPVRYYCGDIPSKKCVRKRRNKKKKNEKNQINLADMLQEADEEEDENQDEDEDENQDEDEDSVYMSDPDAYDEKKDDEAFTFYNNNHNHNHNIVQDTDDEDDQIEDSDDEDEDRFTDPLNDGYLPKTYYEAGFRKKVATGLVEIMKWIKKNQKEVLDLLIPEFQQKDNIENFIGKKYHNQLSQSYLRRLDPNNNDLKHGRGAKFSLFQHINKPNVLLFQAVKSKFKSATEYQIVISLEEANEFYKAKKRLENEEIYNKKQLSELQKLIEDNNNNTDEIPATKQKCMDSLNKDLLPKDPINDHWYNCLKYNTQKKFNPSHYLNDKNKKKVKLLRKRKLDKYKKSKKKKYYIDGHDITKLNKRQLYDWMVNRDLLKNQTKSFKNYTKTELLKEAKPQLKALIKEKEIDCNIDKLWETRAQEEGSDVTLMNWAYQVGLLQMWRDQLYPNYEHLHKPNDDIDVNVELPFWPRETARYQQYRKDEYKEKFEPIIKKLWKVFKGQKWLEATLVHCNFEVDGTKTEDQLLHMIIQSYMENPLMIECNMYYNEQYKLPASLDYLSGYPKYVQTKMWHDINFELWNTTLSRVQVTCSCKSGEQLPSCCAHCSSIMWLLHYSVSLKESLEDALSEKSKDAAIKYHLIDLLPHHNYEKTRQEFWKKLDKKYNFGDKICLCNNVKTENIIRCNACGNYYHPSCLHQSWSDLHDNSRLLSYWRCPTCDAEAVYINKNLCDI